MFGKIFLSPQVKRIEVISNKQGIYKLPHELLNNLRLWEIWKYQEDFEILGWCPAEPVLPQGEKVPLQPWLAALLLMVSR